MLDEALTQRCLCATGPPAARLSPFTRGVRNRVNGIYAPTLAGLVRGPSDPLTRTRGAHMAFWRDDIVRVNGYDEDIQGWGREDSELAARLQNSGIRRRNLKFAAVAWHLHHRTRPQNTVARNHEVFERTVREGRVRCERGISRYLRHGELVGAFVHLVSGVAFDPTPRRNPPTWRKWNGGLRFANPPLGCHER